MRSPLPARKTERPPPQEGGVIVLKKYSSLLRGRLAALGQGGGRATGTTATCQA